MQKTNYFDLLDTLAALADKSVREVCSHPFQDDGKTIQAEANRLLCECEKALFSDFLPPLERHSIATCAHALCRVIHATEALYAAPPLPSFGGRRTEECERCLTLSEQLREEVTLLRKLRKPREIPDLESFRKELLCAREAHNEMQKKILAGGLSRNASESVHRLAALRSALSSAFDTLIEVMLMNI